MPVSIEPHSRRRFLQFTAAAIGAAMLPRTLTAAIGNPVIGRLPAPAAPAPAAAAAPLAADHMALLADVHVSGGIFKSMASRFSTTMKQVLTLPQRPEAILVAGDCAYLSGGRNDYREFARRISPLLDAGMPLHLTLGNHDDREHFWSTLPREQQEAHLTLGRHAQVLPGRHANWFLLDSLDKTNKSPGELGGQQLEWLAAELDARPNTPALLMLHHDPIRNGGEGSLQDSKSLLSLIRHRRQVKALFFGHTHVWNVAQDRSGIYLVNLPATGYTLWGRSFIGWVDCHVQPGGATLQVHALNRKEDEHGQTARLTWRPA